MQGTEMNRDEEIRQAAYKLWQEEGCPDGYDVQHWLRAEAIWLEEKSPRNRPNLRNRSKQPKSLKARNGRQTRTAEQQL